MRIIPYQSMEFVVPKPPHQVAEELGAKVEPWKLILWRYPREHEPFTGKVNCEGFKLARILNYRNNFQPMLYGRFEPTAEGTRVRVRMMPYPPTLCLAGLILGLLVLLGSMPWQLFREGGSVVPLLLVAVMILGILAMVPLGFWWEAPKTQGLLEESLGLKGQGA
jgi:hypothetical protein